MRLPNLFGKPRLHTYNGKAFSGHSFDKREHDVTHAANAFIAWTPLRKRVEELGGIGPAFAEAWGEMLKNFGFNGGRGDRGGR